MGRAVALATAVLVLGVGLGIAAAYVWFGPKHWLSCADAGWPNSVFGDQFGHGDSPTGTSCLVPTTFSWVVGVAIATVTAGAAVSVALIRPLPRRPVPPWGEPE